MPLPLTRKERKILTALLLLILLGLLGMLLLGKRPPPTRDRPMTTFARPDQFRYTISAA